MNQTRDLLGKEFLHNKQLNSGRRNPKIMFASTSPFDGLKQHRLYSKGGKHVAKVIKTQQKFG